MRRTYSLRLRHLPIHRGLFNNCNVPNYYCIKLKKPKSQSRVFSKATIFQLLSHDESTVLAEQRALTERASNIAKQLLPSSKTLEKQSLLPDTPFSIVICGEFNAGKSTLLNALLGAPLLETGPLPTTDSITLLVHGDVEAATMHGNNTIYYTSPHIPPDVLFVDTPGTNAVILNHALTTLDLLPSADLILFCTSADRPFTQTERDLLQQMQHYRKSIVVVINKMDILEHSGGNHGADAKQRVLDFVTEHAADLLGAKPVVLPVSARDALMCKINHTTSDSPMYVRSQFKVLEDYLQTYLTAETKIRSKLLSPIGVVQGVITDCLELLHQQQKELHTDSATLSLLLSHCTAWRTDMKHALDSFRTDIRQTLEQEGNQGQKFMQRTPMLQLFRFSLMNKIQLEMEWKKFQKPLRKQLSESLHEVATLLNSRARAQSQAVVDYLGKRPAIKSQSLVGNVSVRWADSTFHDQLESAVEVELGPNTTTNSLTILHQGAMLSVACQAIVVASGVTAVMNGMDPIMGLPLVTVLSTTTGWGAMNHARSSFIKDRRQIWTRISSDLDDALQVICDKELARSDATIMDGVAPYTRYVESEQERIATMTTESEDIMATAQSLRNRIVQRRS